MLKTLVAVVLSLSFKAAGGAIAADEFDHFPPGTVGRAEQHRQKDRRRDDQDTKQVRIEHFSGDHAVPQCSSLPGRMICRIGQVRCQAGEESGGLLLKPAGRRPICCTI